MRPRIVDALEPMLDRMEEAFYELFGYVIVFMCAVIFGWLMAEVVVYWTR